MGHGGCPMRFGGLLLLLAGLGSGRAMAQAPGRPDLWAVKNVSSVDLSWEAVPDATGYRVYRSADLSQPFALLGATAALSWRDLDAVPGPPANPDLYYYYVTAENASGEGPASNLAFKLNLSLAGLDRAHVYPISIPYRFRRRGPSDPMPTSWGVCQDQPGLTIWLVQRFYQPACNGSGTHSCEAGPPGGGWPIEPGWGYFFTIWRSPSQLSIDVVGAHDPAFEPGGPSAIHLGPCTDCTSDGSPFGRRVISPPWHGRARSAAALCGEIGPDRLIAVIDDWSGQSTYHYCGTAMPDFPLVPGRAYELALREDIDWQPAVWP